MKYHQRAFTLIEVMVSLGLGLLIMYAAITSIQITSQSITRANRLSMENSLLQAGFIIALDEVDTWRSWDDPESNDSLDRFQRAIMTTTKEGLPFSQFPQTFPGPSTAGGSDTKPGDGEVGWDPMYAWPANDPRTWWRGNMQETSGWGQAETTLFDPVFHRQYGFYDRFMDQDGLYPTAWIWLNRQINALFNQMGVYGTLDYLPPSMPIGAMQSFSNKLEQTPTGAFIPFVALGSPYVKGTFGSSMAARDSRVLNRSFGSRADQYVWPFSPLRKADDETKPYGEVYYPNNQRLRWERMRTKVSFFTQGGVEGYGNSEGYGDFQDLTLQNVLGMKAMKEKWPSSWPQFMVYIQRYLYQDRFVALSTIRLDDPLTARQLRLSFPTIGTTLRGARAMRLPGDYTQVNGWARWYGPGHPDNTKTIDAP
jgi:prepilin-type N-terminal cleavage/methylation domain-containing protein